MMYLVFKSFLVEDSFDLENYTTVYNSIVNMKALMNTLNISILATLLSVCITFPLAWLVGRTNLPYKGFFRTVFVAPYMIPPHVGAIAWTQLLNPNVGYLNEWLVHVFGFSQAPFNIYTMGGLIWVMTLFYAPFAFITISRALEKMDPTLEEASRVSGASPFKTLKNVTLPLVFPSIVAGGVLVFIGVGSAFGIPAIIGMPGQIEVLTTRIVTYVYLGTGKGIREATALAVSLMVVANALLYFMTFLLSRKEYTTISGKSTRPNLVDLGCWKWPIVGAVSIYSLITVFIPIGSIVVTSMIKSLSRPITIDNLTFDKWWAAIENNQYMEPLYNSFVTGFFAATISVFIALLIAYLLVKTRAKGRSIPDSLATWGGATPSVVIALALIITFSGQFGINLYSTLAMLVVAYVVKHLTIAVRPIAASMSQVHSSLEEAALSSGASWLRAMKDIMLPLIGPALVAAWFLVFMASFYELTMSIILYGSNTKTIGVLLYELQTYADPQDASVLSVIVLFIVLIGNIILRRISGGNMGI